MFTRGQLVALVIAAPAILGAIALAVLGASQVLRPSLPKAPPAEASLADAIVEGDVEGAFAFIHAGQDPNVTISFRHPDLTAGREVTVSPLLIAVAAHRDDIVNLLLSVGVDARLRQNRSAVCLAHDTDEAIAAIFAKLGEAGWTADCPALDPGSAAPLLAFVQ